ncbi:uncharacterized protein RJT21DRAFT_2465 [Scheffersomyces amazonensis]|uniref:uncharacterized protein n=1 Tax=Scheffersomyces amazonensis TaxID=1078765 RepID=UPI00315DF5C7
MVTINYEPLEHLPYLDESISPEERAHVEQLIRIELANQFANQNLNNINFHPQQPSVATQLPNGVNNTITGSSVIHRDSTPVAIVPIASDTNIITNHDNLTSTPTIAIVPSTTNNNEINNHSDESQVTPAIGGSIVNNDIISPLHESQALHPLVDQLLPLSTNINRLSPSPLINQEIERYEQEMQDEDLDEDLEEENEFHIIKNGIDSSRYSNPQTTDQLYTSLSYGQLQERNLQMLLNNYQDLSHLNQQQLEQLQSLQQDYVINVNSKRVKIDDINQIRKKQSVDYKQIDNYLHDKWKDGIKNVVELGVEGSRLEENL